MICLFSSPAHASTLRLTGVTDTTFNASALDDTKALGDTFVLELLIDASDTDVNGVEATLQFDGAKLLLLESADASDSFFGAAGVNSDEDHSVFGDVLANNGLSGGTPADTARYAALTNSDSTRANARLARFLFQIKNTATTGLTYVSFKSTASETTAVTGFDTNAANVLTATDSGIIKITLVNETHAVMTVVSPGFTGASAFEFVSIYNPTDAPIDLSKYYLSDDDSNYITAVKAVPTVASGDWIARFPNGAQLAIGETVTVALSSDDVHAVLPGMRVDYEVNQDGDTDGISDMVLVKSSGTRALPNGGEAMVLFQWDGVSDLVSDVDIVVWGTGLVPNKTGKSIDGVDGDAVASTYLGDSATMTNVAFTGVGAFIGQVLRRTLFVTGDTGTNERTTGGNGLTRHDETSESVSVSWAASADSRPWHTMLIAYKIGDYAAAIAEAMETGVEGLYFSIAGARNRADTLTQFDVRSLGTADTANIDTVSVWIDADGDSVISAPDTFVANLTATGAKSWRFSGSLFVAAGSSRRLIVALTIGDTVQNGETVLLRIDSQAIIASISDSGSFVALTNNNSITLVAGVLKIAKLAEAAAVTLTPGDTGVTIAAVRITGANTDTLTNISLSNQGSLNDADVSVQMWRDADQSFTYSAGDVLVATLGWVPASNRWETTGLNVVLAAGGDTFVFTLGAFDTALAEGDSFVASFPASSADAVNAETGPALVVTNVNAQTLINAPGIARHVVIAAVYPDAVANDAAGEWLLLYNPTDTPQSIQNWTLRDAGATAITLPDSTLAAHGWFLVTDVGWTKDNSNWPNSDLQGNLAFNNTADGMSLYDSNVAVIDRFGFGLASPDFEGSAQADPAPTNSYDIYVRRANALSTKTDILIGGRDEFGGAGYDSYDNLTDFIRINGVDTNFWTLRSSASATETPAQKTTVVKIFDTVPSSMRIQGETGITAAALYIQGETTASGSLTAFRVEATDTIADTNFVSIQLYRDVNGNARWDAGDSLVATLLSIGGARWETTGISSAFNSLTGETFLVVLNLSDTLTTDDTFQARILARSVGSAGADSGPSVTRVNATIVTLANLSPLQVIKNANITSETVAPSADTITVIAFRVIGNVGGDTLTRFTIDNSGNLDTADIANVRLWKDNDLDSQYSTGDALVATLSAVSARRWDTTLLYSIGTGANFVVTIDLGSAGNTDTFKAVIPSYLLNATVADTGPSIAITEPGIITVSSSMAIRILLTEMNTVTAPDFVEALILDDGNGGLGVNMRDWKLAQLASGTDRKIIGDTDNNGTSDTDVFVRTGERIVFIDLVGVDSDIAVGGVVDAYNVALSLTGTEDVVVLYDPTNTARDAVVWSNRDGVATTTWENNFASVIALGQWASSGNPDTAQNNAVTPKTGTSFAAGLSIQRGGITDRDTYLDWGEATTTRGAANAIESPAVAPARIANIGLSDVPDDLGGSLRLTWNPDTSNGDFLEYRIYLETAPLRTMLDTNIVPRSLVTDSSLGTVDVSGLVNGDSYYAVVTAVDTYGLEFRFGLSDTGSVAPVINVTGTPVLLLNEIRSQATAGPDTDYIEIFVKNDGNPTGNLNLSGWKIEWHSGGSKTLGNVTVATGDYMLLSFNEARVDDTDSTGDGIVNLYDATTGLIAGSGYARILTATDTLVDFVFYADRTTAPAAAVLTAVRQAVDSGAWIGDSVNNSAVNASAADGGFATADVLARDASGSDTTNSRDDWNVTTARSRGTVNTGVENPITVPDSRAVRILRDLPNDLGGTIEVGWDTIVLLTDFIRYNVYVETQPIGTRIDTSIFQPRATITDSSVGLTTVSGLLNGESQWVVVTVTDSWGHERRRNLMETGPVVPVRDVAGTPIIRFSEVKFSGTDTTLEFIELRVMDDGNAGGPLNIAGFKVAADDTVAGDIISFGAVTVTDSDYIVLWSKAGTSETDSGLDGVVNIYNLPFTTSGLVESDEGLFLIQGSDTILDFVSWSNRDGASSAGEITDLGYAIARGAWAGLGVVQDNARNPFPPRYINDSDFDDSGSIVRDRNLTDNNGDTDWAIDTTPTPGAQTTIVEAPFVAPLAIAGTNASDLPNDLGGSIKVTWTPSGSADVDHYNIYRETTALTTSLYNTNFAPRDSALANDSTKVISGLTNGETWYVAVTAVDYYGNEQKTGLAVDSAAAIADVTGETLLITEVSFKEGATGVLGHDWIEIRVVGDGNPTGFLDLTSWRLVTRDGTKIFGSLTVGTGDLILIHMTAGTDEVDSNSGNADGIVDIYDAGGALTGTDNHVTLFRSFGDTEDFVSWVDANGYTVQSETDAVTSAGAAGQWTDIVAPAGIGPEDGVNSDSVATNNSIKRSSDTTDANTKNDWVVDTDPTPGISNDSITYWRLTGTLDLESRALDGGCTVLAGNGVETHYTTSDNAGSFVLRVPAGVWTLRGETTHYLRKAVTGITVSTISLLNQSLGVLYAGDANGDNRIDIFDGSITKYAIDKATGNAAADHVDPVGTINAVDLQAVRDNFGRAGD